MKSKLLTILLIAVMTSVNAQQEGDLVYSFHAGISLSNATGINDTQSVQTRVGFNSGFSMDYYLSETWSGKLGLIYNQNGWDDGPFESGSFIRNVTFTLHYVTASLSPNLHFGPAKNWYINLGPYISALAGANASTAEVKDRFRDFDIGLCGSLGIQFNVTDGISSIFIELAGQEGFSDIVIENDGDAVRNTRQSLNVGVKF